MLLYVDEVYIGIIQDVDGEMNLNAVTYTEKNASFNLTWYYKTVPDEDIQLFKNYII